MEDMDQVALVTTADMDQAVPVMAVSRNLIYFRNLGEAKKIIIATIVYD